jgi:hypothetical protein
MAPPSQLVNQLMNDEVLTRVVAAIAAGKYSWACVLILQMLDYNPALYIPYRTYQRLIKENHRDRA